MATEKKGSDCHRSPALDLPMQSSAAEKNPPTRQTAPRFGTCKWAPQLHPGSCLGGNLLTLPSVRWEEGMKAGSGRLRKNERRGGDGRRASAEWANWLGSVRRILSCWRAEAAWISHARVNSFYYDCYWWEHGKKIHFVFPPTPPTC